MTLKEAYVFTAEYRQAVVGVAYLLFLALLAAALGRTSEA